MRACLLAGVLLAAGTSAQPIFDPAPNWQSSDMQVSTGGALVDLNGDGWLDFVVSNGNDISIQRVVVYFNTGAGTFQTSPGWQSADAAYFGHCDMADVNGDGWPDVAAGVLLAQGGPAAKVYINNAGTLGALPAWTSSISADSFGVAFGDMNGDGRPDLAIASGDPYGNLPFLNAVYLNVGGTLAATPSWQPSDARNFMNLCWVDADRDGWL